MSVTSHELIRRNSAQFQALIDVVLPARSRAHAGPLRVLCLGCASGEEAYTLAIVLREHLPEREISVLSLDANPVALQKAARARYAAWALRETPEAVQRRWFKREGPELVLDRSIVASVSFEERNLAIEQPDIFLPEHFDVVFFRNVFMYFTHAAARAAIARVARTLAPGGYLFVGHAETLRGLSNAFHLCHSHDTFYYLRRAAGDEVPATSRGSQPPVSAQIETWQLNASVSAADGGQSGQDAEGATLVDASWIDTIARSSGRIAQLAAGSRVLDVARSFAPDRVAPDLRPVLALLQEERFAEALQAIDALPEIDSSSDGLLLRAVLLTHSGQLQEAERVTTQLLQLDELHAGAHYLCALCCEGSGDRAGAIWHDQTASYLDPSFAMPRLHLGLLARRTADLDAARRELSQALLLLEREDASRVMFFGGGFGREMLISLCRAELSAAGGVS